MALNASGLILSSDAKKCWKEGNKERAEAMLEQALKKIERALERLPGIPIYLGNKGYILFLLGKIAEAKSVLVEAIRLGGEDVRRTELKNAEIFPLP